MDEQEKHDAFGRMFAHPDDGFRVMRLWQDCSNHQDQWGRKIPQRELFVRRAKAQGYSQKIINTFLNLQ